MFFIHFSQVMAVLSLAAFLGSLVGIPLLVNRMPVTYFVGHCQKKEEKKRRHPLAAAVRYTLRNVVGLALIGAGIAMLLLPGQGILTILIGLCVMDFPLKARWIQFLVQKKQVRNALNWIRKKGNKAPFVFDDNRGSRYDGP